MALRSHTPAARPATKARARGRELLQVGDNHVRSGDVCLELHEVAVLRDAAVRPELPHGKPRVRTEGLNDVCHLVRNALGAGLHHLGAACGAG